MIKDIITYSTASIFFREFITDEKESDSDSPLSAAQVAEKLTAVIGRELTAYTGNVRDVRSLDRWIVGENIDLDAEERLRLAWQIV